MKNATMSTAAAVQYTKQHDETTQNMQATLKLKCSWRIHRGRYAKAMQ